MQAILQTVHGLTARAGRVTPVLALDGKPLVVSPVSKDRQATSGHVAGGMGKGYKLHAVVSEDQRLVCWSVMPLHVAEQSVAMAFVEHCPAPGCLLLADSNYDSAPLYKAATRAGMNYLTYLKGQKQVKGGRHHAVTLRQMGPARREAVRLWKTHRPLCRLVMAGRVTVERTFSALT